MRVFVLCTGRCGSTTFAYACQHMSNFSVGHESRAKFIGDGRLDYPDNHIEIDNRLSWFLGRLENKYADDAHYVHLTRNADEVAASYARKMGNPASIGAAHKRSILMNSPQDDLEVCLDVVDTMTANIETFLKGKSNVMHVALESVDDDFSKFWDWISATGDKEAALAEWKVRYNDSETGKGAIRPTLPDTELARLRRKCKELEDDGAGLRQGIEEIQTQLDNTETARRESLRALKLAEHRIDELEQRYSQLQGMWFTETGKLRSELCNRDLALADLRKSLNSIKKARKRYMSIANDATLQRDALDKYSSDIEERYGAVMRSRTWRVFEPYRQIMGTVKKNVLKKDVPSNELPQRPHISRQVLGKRKKSKFDDVPVVRRLDKRLWGGFSVPAERELLAYLNDENVPVTERADAAYSLARWHSVQGEMATALQHVRHMRSIHPDCASEARQYLAEALFLCRLGKAEEARSILESIETGFNPTVQLMLANTWNPAISNVQGPVGDAENKVLEYLNSIYDRFGLGLIEKRDGDAPLSIDNLRAMTGGKDCFDPDGKVTVIVPVYNAEDTIETALRSIAEQTWQNLEVLVVDDCSSDNSTSVIADFCSADDRFKLIVQEQNGGSYPCRNRALDEATGHYVTIHDSDDWSHPEKIRCLVQDLRLEERPYNLATWVRTTDSLAFFGNSRTLHELIRPDHSSGLFPIETFERYGKWDAVRISADTELYWRIESALGNKKWMFNKRQILKECPLSFGRMMETSLTQTGATSVMTIYHGVRREYRDAADFFHAQGALSVDSRPEQARKPSFPVPNVMDPDRPADEPLTALLVGDWNDSGVIVDTILQLLRIWGGDSGLRFGLFHYPHYMSDVSAPLNHAVRGFAWENNIRIVVAGEAVDAQNVLLVAPRVLEYPIDRFPTVTSKRVVALDQEAFETGVEGSTDVASMAEVQQRVAEYFGQESEWVASIEALSQVVADSAPLPVRDDHSAAVSSRNSASL